MVGERTARAYNERLNFTIAGTDAPTLPRPVLPAPGDIDWQREDAAPMSGIGRSRALTRLGQGISSAAETEWERGTGFVLVPVFWAAGAIIHFTLPFEPRLSVLLVGAVATGIAAFLVRAGTAIRMPILVMLFVLVGALSGAIETWRHSTLMLGSDISTRLTGRVVAIEDRADGRKRLTIDVISTERPKLRYAPERIRATAREIPDGLMPGNGVTGVARLLPATGPARPYGYDFAFESFFDDIGANGFFLSGPFIAEISNEPGFLHAVAAWIERQRMALARHIRNRIAGPEGEVAAALVAGIRGGIPEDVTEALRTTGLAHVLAISGLHMALVAGTMVGAVRLVFALFPGFSSRYPVKKYAAFAGLAALVLYLVISGAAVAAQRSFIMFAVMLVAVLFDRAALTMRNLAIAAIIILAIAPHEAMGPSFQMSFAATAALIGAYGWYAEYRMRQPAAALGVDRSALARGARLVLLFMAGLAVTSIIAGLATGLFAAWHFQRVAPLGLAANLAAMPIVTIAVMPLAVGGVAMLPFGLDGVFFAGMGKALALVIAIARELAEHSPFDIVGAIPPQAIIVLTVALVIATVATTWLRALCIPFLVAGTVLLAMRDQPDILVSEDARLIGIARPGGELAVNRNRPSSFTTGIWSAALQTHHVVGPGKAEDGDIELASAEQVFRCAGELCVARHKSGAVIVHAKTGDMAAKACSYAALIIIDDATATDPCRSDKINVITKKDLALRGSAESGFRVARRRSNTP